MITQEFLNQSLKRGMKKSAQVSGSAKSSLIGAGLGAGLGGLAWLLRPKDRDQNQWREALISILGGAALGGAGGWGFHHLTNKTPIDAAKSIGKTTKNIVSDIVNTEDNNVKKEDAQTSSGDGTVYTGSPIDKRLANTSIEARKRNANMYSDTDSGTIPQEKTTRDNPFRVHKTDDGKNVYYTDRKSWNWEKRPDDPQGRILWSSIKRLDNSFESLRAKGIIRLFYKDKKVSRGIMRLFNKYKKVPQDAIPLYVEVPNNDTFRIIYQMPNKKEYAWTWERK